MKRNNRISLNHGLGLFVLLWLVSSSAFFLLLLSTVNFPPLFSISSTSNSVFVTERHGELSSFSSHEMNLAEAENWSSKFPQTDLLNTTRESEHMAYTLSSPVLSEGGMLQLNVTIKGFSKTSLITLIFISQLGIFQIFEKDRQILTASNGTHYLSFVCSHKELAAFSALSFQLSLNASIVEGIRAFLTDPILELIEEDGTREILPLYLILVKNDQEFVGTSRITQGDIQTYLDYTIEEQSLFAGHNATLSLRFINPDSVIHSYQLEIIDYSRKLKFIHGDQLLVPYSTLQGNRYYLPSSPMEISLEYLTSLTIQPLVLTNMLWACFQLEFRLLLDGYEIGSYIFWVNLNQPPLRFFTFDHIHQSVARQIDTTRLEITLQFNSTSFLLHSKNTSYIRVYLPGQNVQFYQSSIYISKNTNKSNEYSITWIISLSELALKNLASLKTIKGEVCILVSSEFLSFYSLSFSFTPLLKTQSSPSLIEPIIQFYKTRTWWQWILLLLGLIVLDGGFFILFALLSDEIHYSMHIGWTILYSVTAILLLIITCSYILGVVWLFG